MAVHTTPETAVASHAGAVVPLDRGPLTPEQVVAVARYGAPIEITAESLAEVARTRAVDRGAGRRSAAALRHLHRLRRAGHPAHPASSAHPAAAQPDPLARRRLRTRGRARGRPRPDAAADLHPGHRSYRRPARRPCRPTPAMLNAGITPVVHEYGSLGCSGDLAPLAHCALALMGEGVVRDHDRRTPAHRRGLRRGRNRAGRSWPRRKGLALINGTDGMLGMLVAGARRSATGC